jgi:hypothetical protein
LAPLGLYGLFILRQTIVSIHDHGLTKSLFAAPLIVLTHIAYGLGFWRGLFTRLKPAQPRSRTEVVIERIAV